jgi:hypothetical protein
MLPLIGWQVIGLVVNWLPAKEFGPDLFTSIEVGFDSVSYLCDPLFMVFSRPKPASDGF